MVVEAANTFTIEQIAIVLAFRMTSTKVLAQQYKAKETQNIIDSFQVR